MVPNKVAGKKTIDQRDQNTCILAGLVISYRDAIVAI
jgi:hypothetical protein